MGSYCTYTESTNPIDTIPAQMVDGIQGKQSLVNNEYDDDEVACVVEAACKEVLGRTGGAGFPILCDDYAGSKISAVKRGVERAGASALVYHRRSNECCSEAEVEEWLRRRRSGKEEKRCLITDEQGRALRNIRRRRPTEHGRSR